MDDKNLSTKNSKRPNTQFQNKGKKFGSNSNNISTVNNNNQSANNDKGNGAAQEGTDPIQVKSNQNDEDGVGKSDTKLSKSARRRRNKQERKRQETEALINKDLRNSSGLASSIRGIANAIIANTITKPFTKDNPIPNVKNVKSVEI